MRNPCEIRYSERYPCKQGHLKGPPFEICPLYRITVPFCRECGGEVETTWKFCPHCNSSQQTASVSVQDGVISGDVTITQNQIDTSGLKLECPTCKVEGNIKLYLCKLVGCESKACKECISKYSGFCSRKCERTNYDIEWERSRPEREAKAEAKRIAKREEEAQLEEWRQERQAQLQKMAGRVRYALIFLILALFIAAASFVKLDEIFYEVECSNGELIGNDQILDGVENCEDDSDEIESTQNQEIKESFETDAGFWIIICLFALVSILFSGTYLVLYWLKEPL